jgi:hypothetical protein
VRFEKLKQITDSINFFQQLPYHVRSDFVKAMRLERLEAETVGMWLLLQSSDRFSGS